MAERVISALNVSTELMLIGAIVNGNVEDSDVLYSTIPATLVAVCDNKGAQTMDNQIPQNVR